MNRWKIVTNRLNVAAFSIFGNDLPNIKCMLSIVTILSHQCYNTADSLQSRQHCCHLNQMFDCDWQVAFGVALFILPIEVTPCTWIYLWSDSWQIKL